MIIFCTLLSNPFENYAIKMAMVFAILQEDLQNFHEPLLFLEIEGAFWMHAVKALSFNFCCNFVFSSNLAC
jgi:hypothetical protein